MLAITNPVHNATTSVFGYGFNGIVELAVCARLLDVELECDNDILPAFRCTSKISGTAPETQQSSG